MTLRRRQRVVSFTAVLLLCVPTTSTYAVFRIWDPQGLSFDWHTATNWDPTGVPTTNDDVQISGAGLTTLSADTAAVNSLTITGGLLQTNGHILNVDENGNGLLTISGSGSVAVSPPAADNDALFVDDVAILGNSGRLDIANGAVARIDAKMMIDTGGTLRTVGPGFEFVVFTGSAAATALVLDNNGTVSAERGGSALLRTLSEFDGTFDLDGSNERGVVEVDADTILFISTPLNDAFDGQMEIGNGGGRAQLSISEPWTNCGVISLNNGLLGGSALDNSQVGTISGHGSIQVEHLTNDGIIAAHGGTLVIRPDEMSDLDGTLDGGRLVAVDGDIEVPGPFGIIFAGTARAALNHEIRFSDGSSFTLANRGEAQLIQGAIVNTTKRIFLSGGSSVIVSIGEGRLEAGGVGSEIAGAISLTTDLRITGDWLVRDTCSVTGEGSLIVDNGSALISRDGVRIDSRLMNQGHLTLRSGVVGQVARLEVGAGFTQAPSGMLEIEVRNVLPGTFDVVSVDGNVQLAGTLAVLLDNQFEPVTGNTFTFIETKFGNVVGTFDTLDAPVFNGKTFEVVYNPQSVVLHVVDATANPGDLDFDGDVDDDDVALFVPCLTGPSVTYDAENLPDGCTLASDTDGFIPADIDRTGHVDLIGFRVLQRCFSGADIQSDPACAD